MSRTPAQLRRYDCLKRFIDIVASAFGLLLLLPVQLLLALLVARNLGRPVLFRQARPGKGEAIFHLYKFRSMKNVDASRNLVTDEQRLTSFGKRLRSTSLDELPSLWNVLKGDMSLVGPRPLLPAYLPLYNERQKRRHEVRPGVTGLAQVSGRNAVSWDERFEYDVTYVENRSLWLDLKILAVTFLVVFKRKGISSETSATMEPFTGAKK